MYVGSEVVNSSEQNENNTVQRIVDMFNEKNTEQAIHFTMQVLNIIIYIYIYIFIFLIYNEVNKCRNY